MYVHQEKDKCCGCTACMAVCPKKAIHMKADLEGFLYPEIDESVCIGCNLCRAVCDFTEIHDWQHYAEPIAYAARHKSDMERMASRSGGIFTALSDYFLSLSGVVYGAGYDSNWRIIHKRATNRQERDEMRGSKYVQSNMIGVFNQVIRDLCQGKYVLFSGTHCQCGGLKQFLTMKRIDISKLFVLDIVCHGVPSPLIWEKYKEYMVTKYPGKIDQVDFRNKKKYGWRAHVETLSINKRMYDTEYYKDLFYGHCSLRPSCYVCPYKNLVHDTELTIADLWGVEKCAPELDDNRGVSLVLINNDKGRTVFNKVKTNLIVKKSELTECLQPPLVHPFPEPENRCQFWQDLNTKSFEYILTHYTSNYGWKSSVKNYLRKIYHALR